MKPVLHGIGFLLLFMLACTQPSNDLVETRQGTSLPTEASPELSAIDSLMWRRPDSALMHLIPCFDICCREGASTISTPYDRHYAHLLLAELLYKNDYQQTNRLDLLRAVDYFDSLVTDADGADTRGKDTTNVPAALSTTPKNATPNDIFLAARAHYIKGVGYYENDSMVPACKEYLKALEIMEDCFKEKELVGHKARFVALTYTRLCTLFSDTYLHEPALYFAQLSYASNQKLDVPLWHRARMLCEIGIQYDIMDQLDSAEYYYKKADVVLNDTNSLLFRDISTRQAFLLYKKRGIGENTLTQLHYLINQSDSEAEFLLRCLTIGEVFYHEKQFDSAWHYLNKVYNNTEKVALKKQAAEWMLEICKTQGKDSEIFEYASFLAPFANQEENQSEIKSQLTEQYNVYRQASLSRQHHQDIKKIMTISLMVMVGLISGLLAYTLLYYNNKRRKRLLEVQIEEEKHSHDMKQKALSGRLKQSNQKLQESLKRIEDLEAKPKIQENNVSYSSVGERYEVFRQSPICLEILGMVNDLHADKRVAIKTNSDITEYKAFAMSLSQTAQLTKTVETLFPNFYTALKSKYASFDRNEWLHCCLYLLRLDKMSICVLLQEPYYSCRRYTLKMEKEFGCQQGLADFLIEQLFGC